ncbi:hypothetical protein A2U01_0116388, partial [Trifolium medium]|nr:hypothetical protein [Trifolium medium]
FCHLRVAQGMVARCAIILSRFGVASINCAARR